MHTTVRIHIGVPDREMGNERIPVQAIQALPYILTVAILARFAGRAIAPKADGVPYVKER